MEFKTFKTFSTLYTAFETTFYSVQKKGSNIALSGGSLKTLYKQFSKDWPKLFELGQIFWQVDERFVPQNDPNSNFKLITDAFKKAAFNLNYFDTEIIDWHSIDFEESRAISLAVKDYNEMLKTLKVKFDLCVLGIGPDGHIGSLFPHSKALSEKKNMSIQTQTDVFDVKNRLTITYPQILKSKEIVVVLQGKEKLDVFKKLKANKLSYFEFPANKLHEHKNVKVLFGNY